MTGCLRYEMGNCFHALSVTANVALLRLFYLNLFYQVIPFDNKGQLKDAFNIRYTAVLRIHKTFLEAFGCFKCTQFFRKIS